MKYRNNLLLFWITGYGIKSPCEYADVSNLEWIFSCGYSFEHEHYSMAKFSCKSQYSAKLYELINNLVPGYGNVK